MSILTKEIDLFQFITQKCQNEIDICELKILKMDSKTIFSSISKTFKKFNIMDYCLSCMDTIHNLFWIILNYSNNLKLTMFLCDRAILLFNEYIVMTKTDIYGTDNSDINNLREVKIFIYKKSIGPLILNNKNKINKQNNNILNKLQKIGNLIYNCHYNCFISLIPNNLDIQNLDRELEDYIMNYNETILEQIYLLNEEQLKLLKVSLDDININDNFNKLNLIQKSNSICLLCYLISNNKLLNTNNSYILNNIIIYCKNKFKYFTNIENSVDINKDIIDLK
jgi:hypothetical protein